MELPHLPHALELWNNAARMSLPSWLYVWLGFLTLTFLSTLLFVRTHPMARWALIGVVGSHVAMFLLGRFDLAVSRKGLVSLMHVVFWLPVLILLVRNVLPYTTTRTAYGIWCRTIVFVLTVALVFDLRDAGAYLYFYATGHPVFAATP